MTEDNASSDVANLQKNYSTKLIVRVSVGSVLAILLVLAAIDRGTYSRAKSTTDAWLNELKKRQATDEPELKLTDLPQHIIGSPERTGEPSRGSVEYTWTGILRSFKTTVLCGGRQSPVVVSVEGPSL